MSEKCCEPERCQKCIRGGNCRAKAIEREKMAAVGQLAAGMTHEINTPTTYIRGNLQVLLKYQQMLMEYVQRLDDSDVPDRNLLKKIRSVTDVMYDVSRATLLGTERIMTIIGSMQGYIREHISEDRFINFMEPLTDALTLVWNRIKHAGRVMVNGWRYHHDEVSSFTKKHESLIFACNAQRISQLFVILLNNSVDAWCSNKIRHIGNDSLCIEIDVEIYGRQLECTFSDNAGGMDPEVAQSVFEPFVTGHADTGGTGLGMAIAKQIVREHNGIMTLVNSCGKGVCWKITLSDNC